jgi:nitroreductase
MNRIDAMMNRRSIRKFTDQPVEREKIQSLLRAAMQAPSAKNTQCWEFLVIEKAESKEAVSKMSPYAMCAKNAAALILVMGNYERIDHVLPIWAQDLSAATQNILIQAEAEGLGATWLGMYPFEERIEALRDYFDLGEMVIPFSVVALGYKATEKEPEDRYDPEKVHWEVEQ